MGMMCLGQFVFDLSSAPYQSFQRQKGWRHPSSARVGLRPARQYIGPDDESVTLAGVLLPSFAGDLMSLDTLNDMAEAGDAYVLVDGNGRLYGRFVIESIDQTGTEFFKDGTPRKVDFSLALKRVDDGDVDLLGEDADAARKLVVEPEEEPEEEGEPAPEEDVPEDESTLSYGNDGVYSGRPITGQF